MERQRHRFLSNIVAHIFGRIDASVDFSTREKTKRKRRVLNNLGYSYPRNGLRERDRRVRQIAAGSLRTQNGLEL